MEEPDSIASLLNAYGPGLSDLLSFGGDDGWAGFGLSDTELQSARINLAADKHEEGQIASTSHTAATLKHKRARSSISDPTSRKDNKGSAMQQVTKNPQALKAELEAKLAQLSHLKQTNQVLEERCKLLEYVRAMGAKAWVKDCCSEEITHSLGLQHGICTHA